MSKLPRGAVAAELIRTAPMEQRVRRMVNAGSDGTFALMNPDGAGGTISAAMDGGNPRSSTGCAQLMRGH